MHALAVGGPEVMVISLLGVIPERTEGPTLQGMEGHVDMGKVHWIGRRLIPVGEAACQEAAETQEAGIIHGWWWWWCHSWSQADRWRISEEKDACNTPRPEEVRISATRRRRSSVANHTRSSALARS